MIRIEKDGFLKKVFMAALFKEGEKKVAKKQHSGQRHGECLALRKQKHMPWIRGR